MFDIFNQDAFSVTSMTDALREVKYVPSYISRMGLFTTSSVDTLTVAIERQSDNSLILIPSSPRGSHGATLGSVRRNMVNISIPHYQINDALLADSVQGVRAFGQERQTEIFMQKIAERAQRARQSFELTAERQRLALITQGKLLDADGSTLVNYYTQMGESQAAEIDWDLDNASPAKGALRTRCETLIQSLAEDLDGLPMSGVVVICGNQFWKDLMLHNEVYDLYLGWSGAVSLQKATIGNGSTGIWGEFEFAGITFINYRGGQSVGVDTDKAYAMPYGVPDLFRSVYAPADYIDTVNTMGVELYAKQRVMDNDKGVALEFQSNVLHYCTRPRVLRRLRRT